jgi:hypothetical protein
MFTILENCKVIFFEWRTESGKLKVKEIIKQSLIIKDAIVASYKERGELGPHNFSFALAKHPSFSVLHFPLIRILRRKILIK